jgi:hypothetical protein
MPAIAENEVGDPEQITFVPVMLHEDGVFTTNVAIVEVTDPHVPVTITRYVFPSVGITGEIV